MTPVDPLATAALVAGLLEDLGIPYVIGGCRPHVVSLLKVTGQNLDRGYLATVAAEEGVADLLSRATENAGAGLSAPDAMD